MSSEKKKTFETQKQDSKTYIDQVGDEDSVEDVVMFRVKTALRAGPRVEC